MNIIIFLILLMGTSGFLFTKKRFSGCNFIIKDKEINKKIKYTLPNDQQKIINKINGLYALIGPDVNIKEVSTLFDLFTGDGIIQSIFFQNGELTFTKNYIRTEKLLYEQANGKLSTEKINILFYSILNKLNLLPNVLGVANTALLELKDKVYALYERDTPYLLNIDFDKKTINTAHRCKIETIDSFSAHSTYDEKENKIHSIQYNMMDRSVHYNEFYRNLTLSNQVRIKMEYLPIVHDFLKTENNIIIIDSPLVIDVGSLFKKSIPIMLDTNKKTIINVLNRTTMNIDKFYTDTGFYVFHYADYQETDETIEIYACLYEKMDFSELNICGKYRKIIINRVTKEVHTVKNQDLENLNLEFPVKFGNKILFRRIENRHINGFVVCQDLEIIKQLYFPEKFICGEPAINYIDNIPYLFCFAINEAENNSSFLILINMETYEMIEIPIDASLNIGFHSIFINQ